jgi:hypothetical protein
MTVITKIKPNNSNNMAKIIITIVNDGLSFLNKNATGKIITANSIKISPILSRFSIKQIHTKLP